MRSDLVTRPFVCNADGQGTNANTRGHPRLMRMDGVFLEREVQSDPADMTAWRGE